MILKNILSRLEKAIYFFFTQCIIFDLPLPSSFFLFLFCFPPPHPPHFIIFYFSIQDHIDPTLTLHRSHIDPTSIPHRPYIDPALNGLSSTTTFLLFSSFVHHHHISIASLLPQLQIYIAFLLLHHHIVDVGSMRSWMENIYIVNPAAHSSISSVYYLSVLQDSQPLRGHEKKQREVFYFEI